MLLHKYITDSEVNKSKVCVDAGELLLLLLRVPDNRNACVKLSRRSQH